MRIRTLYLTLRIDIIYCASVTPHGGANRCNVEFAAQNDPCDVDIWMQWVIIESIEY